MRTCVYVDAFNLYYGSLKGTPHKWLDLSRFMCLSFPQNQIEHIHYFTARVVARPQDPQQPVRQETLLRALATLPRLTIHLGTFLEKPVKMKLANPPASGPDIVKVLRSEEKGSDVNMACQMLVDAFDDAVDAAIVVTNDSDLVAPIRIVRKKFGKKVVALMPCCNGRAKSIELQKVVSKAVTVNAAHLAASQFPNQLRDANGTIHKPASW